MIKNKLDTQDLRLFQLFALIALLLVMIYPVIVHWGWIHASCPFSGSVEHPCPSCGLTTAWWLLYAGQLNEAQTVNPNALPLLLLVLLQVIWRINLIYLAPKIKHPLRVDLIISGCLILLLAGGYCLDLISFVLQNN